MAKLKVHRLVGLLIIAILVVGAGIGPGEAATFTTPFVGDLEINLIIDGGTFAILFFDVRGGEVFLVSDPGPVGFVLATDMFDFVTPSPFPNALLRAVNTALDQNAILVFDAATVDVSGPDLKVTAEGVPVGLVTDPALSAFVGPLFFSFVFDPLESAVNPFTGVAFLNFDFVSVRGVPGPASLILLVLGALASGLGLIGRRR